MTEGQTKKGVIKKARKKPVEPTKPAEEVKPAEVEESDLEDPYSQASIDAGSLEGGVSPAPAIREDQPSQASTETPTSSEQPSAAFLDMYRGVRDQMAKEKETEAQQAVTDPAKLERAAQDLASFRSGLGILTEEGTPQPRKDTMLDEAYRRVGEREKRQGIASGLKDLSRRGALTSDLLKEARQRATAAGVSEEQFSSFMGKEGIKTQDFATAAPTESKEEAAQNVMFQRQYGTGLGTLAAMQDPNYELGSGSALRQPARSIGPASGKFRRAARRLRRQGYGAAAQRMALLGEMARAGEPSIDTPALRGQRMAQRIAAAKEARKQDKIASQNPLPAANNQPNFEIPMAPAPDSDQITTQPKVMSPTEKNKADAAARYKKAEQERLKRAEDYGKPYKLS